MLKDANLKVESQRQEIRKLKLEVATLRREIPKQSKKGGKSKQIPAVTDKDDRIALYARKFGVMNEIFVPAEVFLVPDPDFDAMDHHRYSTPENTLRGVTAELFEEIPKDLHPMMQEHTHFRDLVSISL